MHGVGFGVGGRGVGRGVGRAVGRAVGRGVGALVGVGLAVGAGLDVGAADAPTGAPGLGPIEPVGSAMVEPAGVGDGLGDPSGWSWGGLSGSTAHGTNATDRSIPASPGAPDRRSQ